MREVSRASAAISTVGSRLAKPAPVSSASMGRKLTSGRKTKSRCAASARRARSRAKSLEYSPSILLPGCRQASPLSQVGASERPMCRGLRVVMSAVIPISERSAHAHADHARRGHAGLDAADAPVLLQVRRCAPVEHVLDIAVQLHARAVGIGHAQVGDGVGADRIGARVGGIGVVAVQRSEEHTSELQSPCNLVCRLLLEKKKQNPFPELPAVSQRLMDAKPWALSTSRSALRLNSWFCEIFALKVNIPSVPYSPIPLSTST